MSVLIRIERISLSAKSTNGRLEHGDPLKFIVLSVFLALVCVLYFYFHIIYSIAVVEFGILYKK